MKRRTRLSTTAVSAAMVPLLLLVGCGSDDDSNDDSSSSPSSETTPSEEADAPETTEPAPTETETSTDDGADGAAADGSAPLWANPVTTPGDLLTTVKLGDVEVEIYQVGNAKAPKDGMFVDPDTNKPILKEGDDLVFVNYVATNNGAPVDLGSSLISVSPRYDDWKWMQGMDGSSDSDLFAQLEVSKPGVAPGAFVDPSVYTFGTGETFSWGENFKYQKGAGIEFEFTMTPVDAQGDLLHDQKVEATATSTIK